MGWARQGGRRSASATAVGQLSARYCPLLFQFPEILLRFKFQKFFKLCKFIVNHIELRKIQSKILWNTLQ
jgi:hypothetical protein